MPQAIDILQIYRLCITRRKIRASSSKQLWVWTNEGNRVQTAEVWSATFLSAHISSDLFFRQLHIQINEDLLLQQTIFYCF